MRYASTLLVLAMLTPLSAVAEESLDERITPDALEVFASHAYEHQGFALPYRMA